MSKKRDFEESLFGSVINVKQEENEDLEPSLKEEPQKTDLLDQSLETFLSIKFKNEDRGARKRTGNQGSKKKTPLRRLFPASATFPQSRQTIGDLSVPKQRPKNKGSPRSSSRKFPTSAPPVGKTPGVVAKAKSAAVTPRTRSRSLTRRKQTLEAPSQVGVRRRSLSLSMVNDVIEEAKSAGVQAMCKRVLTCAQVNDWPACDQAIR